MYKVEYLYVINSQNGFLNSKESFDHLLQTDENIKIENDIIEYKEKSFKYNVKFKKADKGVQRLFNIGIECEKQDDLNKFEALLKIVRTRLANASNKPAEVLWDDVGSERSRKAYPIIHEIENIMRKLITEFMFINIGQEWIKKVVPPKVANTAKNKNNNKSKAKKTQNYLHELDFIQLSYLLFNKYSTVNPEKCLEKLSTVSKIEELDLEELKTLIPKSNWEKYFCPIVDCESQYLETRWGRLYDLRCAVAHNKFLEKKDFKEIIKISDELKTILNKAINKLNEVKVPEEEKENVILESGLGMLLAESASIASTIAKAMPSMATMAKFKEVSIATMATRAKLNAIVKSKEASIASLIANMNARTFKPSK